jgi:predicted nucleic acid-binding protein
MKTIFVDSNLFLRLLTHDDRSQSERAAELFQDAAAGILQLITGPPVFFEIAWALAKKYREPQEAILIALRSILTYPNLTITDAPIAETALTLAEEKSMTYADAYIVALAESARVEAIATFNRKHFEGVLDLYPLD